MLLWLTMWLSARLHLAGSVRPGVHAPIKSVSVPAPISVVLVFHVTL